MKNGKEIKINLCIYFRNLSRINKKVKEKTKNGKSEGIRRKYYIILLLSSSSLLCIYLLRQQ